MGKEEERTERKESMHASTERPNRHTNNIIHAQNSTKVKEGVMREDQ